MDAGLTPTELEARLAAFPPPTLVDVRRQPAFDADPRLVPGAIRRPPEALDAWAGPLEPWRPVVVYCVRGHEVSQNAAAALRARGLEAGILSGGLERWCAEGRATKPFAAPTRWVTRERPKIDRIACPWLIRRFIDPGAEFFYVPNADVRAFAAANGATAYDIPDVELSHVGELCSFDAFLRKYKLDDPALAELAIIVRGADTARPELAPQAAGLLAISLGLSHLYREDHEMLGHGMVVYDALYAWCRHARGETHTWNPAAMGNYGERMA